MKQKIVIIRVQILPVKIRVFLNVSEKLKSITSNSLEKIFIIRPNGVVSKKEIGACMRES